MSDDACESDDDAHLADIADGAGCTEIWERLSERRDVDTDGPASDDPTEDSTD